ncbi:ankyrin repeat domain-containing protein [uncultured Legionella sp.]|uniref:ankyrin repeat domain-containing protein n=1 Tax=uncultured Legionella sp. TaxID=210934 RepID=UPI002617C4FF|nr:ankyrin repeat domain-containing protein [uncultured Legionella sp.]
MITLEQSGIIKEALNKKIAKNESGEQRNLTPGQSIFLAIKACKEDGVAKEIIDELKSLYLNGVRTSSDKDTITQIGQHLNDNHNFYITTRHEDINNDPIRRYFETHTAYQMLEDSATSLKTEELREFTNNLTKNLYKHMPIEDQRIMEYILAGVMHKSLNKYEQEYAEMIGQLKSHNFHGLSPKACDNLCEIARSTILATNNTMFDKQMPADIYAESIFTMGMDGRGRTGRGDPNREGSSFKGLIREGTPLPEGDIARSTQSPFLRSADQASYMIESQWSQHLFSRQTQVFSNGISSTTLATLRNILMQKRLGHDHQADDFQSYMTAFASLMVFNSGGHSLFEIFEVFKLPQLREVMIEAGVDTLIDEDTLLDEWLLKGQSDALDKAFEASSKYFDEFGAEIILSQTNSPAIENKNGTIVHQAVIDLDADKFAEFLKTNELEIAELIDEKNSSQYTAFMVAAQIGKVDHVKMLYEAGAKVTESMPQKGRKIGVSALEIAIKSEKFPVVKYLLELENVPELTIKKADEGDLRDRAPSVYYACRQKDERILDKIIETSAKAQSPLTDKDKKLALEETIRFENQEGMAFLRDKLEKSGTKLSLGEKQHLLEAAAGRGNVQLFNTLLNSKLLAPTDEVNYLAFLDIASVKNYVAIMKEVLSNQYSLESAQSKIPQSRLDIMMNQALQYQHFDMAVLAILYGANPAKMPIDKNAVSFAEYLKKAPEKFDAFLTDKDKLIIDKRTVALQQIHYGTSSFGEKLLNLLCKFLSILPGVNLGTYYDKRKEAVTRITYQVLTNVPQTNADLGLEEKKSSSEYDQYKNKSRPYVDNSRYSLFGSGKKTDPSDAQDTHKDEYGLGYDKARLIDKTKEMRSSIINIVDPNKIEDENEYSFTENSPKFKGLV